MIEVDDESISAIDNDTGDQKWMDRDPRVPRNSRRRPSLFFHPAQRFSWFSYEMLYWYDYNDEVAAVDKHFSKKTAKVEQ